MWFVEYILFVAILFMASNISLAFLPETLLGEVLFVIYRMAFGIAPLIIIVWVMWIILKIFEDRKLWDMMKRGLFLQGGRM